MPLASLLIYSQFLEAHEYGITSLFFSYIWILGIILTANMHTAIGRFIYEDGQSDSELVGTTLAAVGIPLIIAACIGLWNANIIASFLNLPAFTLWFLLGVVIGQIAESLFVQILTARGQSGLLFAIVMGRSAVGFAVALMLLMQLSSDRYLAILYTEAIAGFMIAAYLLLFLQNDRPWVFSFKVLKSFISYSCPLIPYMLCLTLLVQIDRIMIDRFFSKELTGIYSIGYNLGMLLVLVANGLLNALNPRFFSALAERRFDAVRLDSSIVLSSCALGAVVMMLFGPNVATATIPGRYAEGFDLIPLVSLGAFASVAFQTWGRLINYAKKTYLLAAVAVGATVLKIALNLALMPEFGIIVGPFTTIAAYSLMAVAVATIVNASPDLPNIEWKDASIWFILLGFTASIQQWGAVSRIGFGVFGVIVGFLALGAFMRDVLNLRRDLLKERLL